MLELIKKILPKPLIAVLVMIKRNLYDSWQKKYLFNRMQLKHAELVERVRHKDKIKIVFLAINKSVWKVDPVFRKMLKDPLFAPEILICPYIMFGQERMLEDMKLAYSYFFEKGYPVTMSLRSDDSWVKLDDIKPDIVFFTNPHKLTRKEYYEDAYFNYLSCYIPYYFMATNHAGDEADLLNSNLLSCMWKIFSANDYVHELSKILSVTKGRNCYNYGYPATEVLLTNKIDKMDTNVWKKQKRDKKRIIYAPHHTIENTKKSLSSFLLFSELLKKIAIQNGEMIQWAFKPHPILKSKLYSHPDWGKQKTDEYFNFWKCQNYTQLDNGEYEELFLTSDAIIHDCSSFIVEYAFTGKPCLYLVNQNNLKGLLNDFGKGVMQVYEQARTEEEILAFVNNVIHDRVDVDPKKREYFDAYLKAYYKEKLPSDRIIKDIKVSLGI